MAAATSLRSPREERPNENEPFPSVRANSRALCEAVGLSSSGLAIIPLDVGQVRRRFSRRVVSVSRWLCGGGSRSKSAPFFNGTHRRRRYRRARVWCDRAATYRVLVRVVGKTYSTKAAVVARATQSRHRFSLTTRKRRPEPRKKKSRDEIKHRLRRTTPRT